jgi:hypothetical protein
LPFGLRVDAYGSEEYDGKTEERAKDNCGLGGWG